MPLGKPHHGLALNLEPVIQGLGALDELLQELPEGIRVVQVLQMSKFMGKDVIAKFAREQDQSPVQGNRAVLRARTPATFLITHPQSLPLQLVPSPK